MRCQTNMHKVFLRLWGVQCRVQVILGLSGEYSAGTSDLDIRCEYLADMGQLGNDRSKS